MAQMVSLKFNFLAQQCEHLAASITTRSARLHGIQSISPLTEMAHDADGDNTMMLMFKVRLLPKECSHFLSVLVQKQG